MRRREFITTIAAGAAVWPLAARARAQGARATGAVPVIGLLSPFSRADTEPWHQAFRQGLRSLSWVEGTNVRFEYRFADGRQQLLPGLVAELIELKVDVIVVTVTTDAVPAAKATKTIPIVMASTGDPVGTGLIASLARPGGNITGLTQIATDLAAKRLELLKEIAPGHSRVAVLWDPQEVSCTFHDLCFNSSRLRSQKLRSAWQAKDEVSSTCPRLMWFGSRRRITHLAAEQRPIADDGAYAGLQLLPRCLWRIPDNMIVLARVKMYVP